LKAIRIIYIIAILLGFALWAGNVLGALEIDIHPESPAPLSTITFTATVNEESITEVFIKIKECRDDFCYSPNINESMDSIGSNQYQKSVTLIQDDANNIAYWIVVNRDGNWTDYWEESIKLDLASPSNGNGDGNGSNGIPGFELIGLLISVIIIVLIFKKRECK
jgi:hypothetical protein